MKGAFAICTTAASASAPPTMTTVQMNPISTPSIAPTIYGATTTAPLVVAVEAVEGEGMIRIGSVVWGVRDIPRAAEFWSAVLGYGPLYEPDVDWALLVSPDGVGPRLALKLVGSEANASPRHHLDLYADDQLAEADRLRALGATDVEWEYEEGADYLVLADPDGNRFCVVDAGDEAL